MSKPENAMPAVKKTGRTVTITVSLSTLIGGIMAIGAGFVLVFALGILLGRGHNVEAGIPELERMMPQPGPSQAPVVISGDTPAPAGNNGTAAAGGVIPQSELEYRVNLKPGTGASPPRKTPPAAPKPQDTAREKPQAQKPAETPRSTPTAAPQTAPAASPQPSGDTQVYHYVYQAAAYKDQPSCDAFTARLQKAGFRARTLKEPGETTTWYKTVIDFTGKPDDTDALREKLKANGVPRVIMKSKVPAK